MDGYASTAPPALPAPVSGSYAPAPSSVSSAAAGFDAASSSSTTTAGPPHASTSTSAFPYAPPSAPPPPEGAQELVGLMQLSEEQEDAALAVTAEAARKAKGKGKGKGREKEKEKEGEKGRGKRRSEDAAGAGGEGEGREGEAVVKKKRKQLVACDPCRLRRVKCDKAEMAEGEACSECARKCITCTAEYVKNKPKVVRGGKLIAQAKLLFGEQPPASPDDPPTSLPSAPSHPPPPRPAPSETDPGAERRRASSATSVGTVATMGTSEGRLVGQRVQADVADQLIRTYFAVYQPQCPLVDEAMFMAAFEAAGRVTDNLGPANECLALVIQAWAARSSDHHLVAGPGAPSLSDLRAPSSSPSAPGQQRDFTPVGNRRDEFARAMCDRALRAIDEKGLLRTSSTAACSALCLAEFLVTWDDLYRTSTSGRYLLSAAVEHLRNLQLGVCDEPGEACMPPERASNGTLLWMVYTRDALTSLLAGRSCSLTDGDLALLCDLFTNPITADPAAYVSSDDPFTLSGIAVATIFRYCTNLVRNTVNRLTGPLASRLPVDERTVFELWTDIDQCSQYGAAFRKSVDATTFASPAPKTDVWFRDLVAVKAQHVLGIHSNLIRRLQAEEGVAPESRADGGAYLQMLLRLKSESEKRLLDVSREYTGLLRSYGSELMFSAAFSVEYSEHYLQCMLDSPAWEQGGANEAWTWSAKVDEITSLLDALKLVGWCWAGYDRHIESARAALAEQSAALQTRQREEDQQHRRRVVEQRLGGGVAGEQHAYPPTPEYDATGAAYPRAREGSFLDPHPHPHTQGRQPSQDWSAQPTPRYTSSGLPTGLVDLYASGAQPQQQQHPPPSYPTDYAFDPSSLALSPNTASSYYLQPLSASSGASAVLAPSHLYQQQQQQQQQQQSYPPPPSSAYPPPSFAPQAQHNPAQAQAQVQYYYGAPQHAQAYPAP
ncbi:hypothetical protein JCM8097_009142 [Rhodosporidiobolus ruineniae]